MMPFAVDVAVAFRRGSARGERSQFSSMGICRDRLMRDLGTCINQSILDHRFAFEELATQHARLGGPETHEAFKIARDESDPKARWVNGTPEYSFGISGLRKLFPGARFIHLLRNCEDVAPSMVQLERLAGTKLVANEQEGYELWMQFVQACVEAEEAYGPEVVCRLLYEDLVREPEKSIRRILDFIGEAFAPACLEPLGKRINSSRITAEAIESDPPADPAVVHKARDLWNALREAPPLIAPSLEAAARLEEQFERRVDFVYKLDTDYARAQEAHKKLEEEFAERTEWALHLDQEVAQKSAQILHLQEKLSEHTKWMAGLAEEVTRKDALILKLQKEFEERTTSALRPQAEVEPKDAPVLDPQPQAQTPSPSEPDDSTVTPTTNFSPS
jgi:Sulfotransferase family